MKGYNWVGYFSDVYSSSIIYRVQCTYVVYDNYTIVNYNYTQYTGFKLMYKYN